MELSRREKTLLQALTTRGGRRRSGCCRCEGIRAVRELLEFFPEKIRFVVATERGQQGLGRDVFGVRIVSEREFDELSGTVTGQG